MPNDLRPWLREQINQANDDVAHAISTRNLRLFNEARDRRLLLQARLDALPEDAPRGRP